MRNTSTGAVRSAPIEARVNCAEMESLTKAIRRERWRCRADYGRGVPSCNDAQLV